MPKLSLSLPDGVDLLANVYSCAARKLPLVQKGCHADAHGAVVVGLGPSVQRPETLPTLRLRAEAGAIFFGIKEAILWLLDNGLPCHYSVNMDPSPGEALRTPMVEGVTYCIASTCHPALFDRALSCGASVLVYHSASGVTDERLMPGVTVDLGNGQRAICTSESELLTTEGIAFCPVTPVPIEEKTLYRELFGCDDTMCGGFTVGNRAVALARHMGIGHVAAVGLDFGWRASQGQSADGYYASFVGRQPVDQLFLNDDGKTDGQVWRTRPDLLGSAVELARLVRKGEVEIIGDSLALSLSKHDDEFLDRVMRVR